MQKLGLALSGGGFRATLYHLGVLRYLRDAGILPKVTHINSVSGGSIIAAHAVLNWDRYCGSREDFDEAAKEIVRFVQLDIRNKIVRRFPLTGGVNAARSLLRMGPHRQFTRAGLLELYYQKYLFGDVALSRLPERPRLHMLATNLSEGCLCSFNRNGMLLQRRVPGRRDRFERVGMGLATVPMAVAASSAFPGFFPPLELTGEVVGAEESEFSRQAFTDGGVYDNLGLRMFRCLEQAGLRESTPLRQQDFLELEDVKAALFSADSFPTGTPLRSLWEMIRRHDVTNALSAADQGNAATSALVNSLWEVIRSEQLYLDDVFQHVELSDPGAQSLLSQTLNTRKRIDVDSRLWLNRHIVEASLRQVVGKPCLRINRQEFDAILVSDAGGKFKVKQDGRGGGLVKTALRSSDILMDRVWQLELEAFESTPGVIFLPIGEVVEASQDASALPPELQRQSARIRTDLDRFSDLEVAALGQHGYTVARRICRSQNALLKAEIPAEPAWKPLAVDLPRAGTALRRDSTSGDTTTPPVDPALKASRELQKSTVRKIWSRLFDLRDWTSYVWMAFILLIIVAVPMMAVQYRERGQQQSVVLNAITDMSPDYRLILDLLNMDASPDFTGMPFAEVDTLDDVALSGIDVLSDTRIFDLRGWSDGKDATAATVYTRLTVMKKENVSADALRIVRQSSDPALQLMAGPSKLKPELFRKTVGDGEFVWQLNLDTSRIPVGTREEINFQARLPSEAASDAVDEGRFSFSIPVETGLLEVWMLLPAKRDHDAFEVVSYPEGAPEEARVIVPHSRVEMSIGAIASFRLIDPQVGYRYECRWTWTDEVSVNTP